MPSAKPILGSKDYDTINRTLGDLERLNLDIQQAKAGGVQCDEQDRHCQFLLKAYQQLKQAYFPDRP